MSIQSSISMRVQATMLVALLGLTSCSKPHREPAVPSALADYAYALGDPKIRTWDDRFNTAFNEEVKRIAVREMIILKESGATGPLPTAYYLAISGGGADGAYGAGLLCGWTKAGTRPEFKVVTGISTGALTAPFAFLGPKYDEKLRTVYTSVTTKQIALARTPLAVFFDDALMDTKPLRVLMRSLVDEQMMKDIATEYNRGRFLLVATTDLDANRGVIWNVGAIAASGHPDALNLIHSILIASAAIPAAFPPVMIDVEVDGKKYQEMHVDGGTKAQLFLYPPSLEINKVAEAGGIRRERAAYLIRNSRLDPEWASVQRSTLTIAGRAISSLIQTQGIGDLYRIYLVTRRDGVAFNLSFIPTTFTEKPTQDFDPVYMKKLFDVGFAAATAPGGYPWAHTPPGYAELETTGTPVPVK